MNKIVKNEILFNNNLRQVTKLPLRSEHPELDVNLTSGNSPQRGQGGENVIKASDLIEQYKNNGATDSVNKPSVLTESKQSGGIEQSNVIDSKVTENLANETAPIENSGTENVNTN